MAEPVAWMDEGGHLYHFAGDADRSQTMRPLYEDVVQVVKPLTQEQIEGLWGGWMQRYVRLVEEAHGIR